MTPDQEAELVTREYNPRLSIPNVPEIFARWVEQGKAARSASPRAKLDLVYGTADGERLDLFPTAQPGAPLLVFIHGGYWRSMDKSDLRPASRKSRASSCARWHGCTAMLRAMNSTASGSWWPDIRREATWRP